MIAPVPLAMTDSTSTSSSWSSCSAPDPLPLPVKELLQPDLPPHTAFHLLPSALSRLHARPHTHPVLSTPLLSPYPLFLWFSTPSLLFHFIYFLKTKSVSTDFTSSVNAPRTGGGKNSGPRDRVKSASLSFERKRFKAETGMRGYGSRERPCFFFLMLFFFKRTS